MVLNTKDTLGPAKLATFPFFSGTRTRATARASKVHYHHTVPNNISYLQINGMAYEERGNLMMTVDLVWSQSGPKRTDASKFVSLRMPSL
jgi:hypothetical protein